MTAFAELDLAARTEKLEAAVAEIRKIGDEGEKTEGRVGKSMSQMAAKVGRVIAPLAGAMITAFAGRGMINALETYENRMSRIDRIIQATGGAAGRTSKQLEQQAQTLARASLESVDGIMQAQQTLLTFRNVQGDIFDRTIKSAMDMAAALGGDLNSATMQLAKALENPTEGLSALTRSGTVFTEQQKEMVKAMVDSGDIASAQTFILDELAAQYGDASEAGTRLTKAQDSLGQSTTNLAIAIGQSLNVSDRMAAIVETIDNSLQFLTGNLDLAAGGIAGLATAIGLGYVPAVYAAITATGLWTAALGLLKYALIGTGIGAIAVGLGVAVAYMVRIREATGSWGEAMSLVSDVVNEAFEKIVMKMTAMVSSAEAVSSDMRAAFLGAAAGVVDGIESAIQAVDGGVTSLVNMSIQGVSGLVNVAIDGLNSIIELANKIPGVDIGAVGQFTPNQIGSVLGGASGAAGGIAESLRSEQTLARQAAIDMRAYADILTELSGQPLQSLDALRGALAGVADETVDTTEIVRQLNDALLNPAGGGVEGGGGGVEGGGGAGADDGFAGRLTALTDQFMSEREVIEAWYDEAKLLLEDKRAEEILGEVAHKDALLQVEELYQQQLAALRGQADGQALQNASSFFGSLATIAQAGGERMTKVARGFSAAQALINTWLAASQTLADPTLGFFAKFAAVASVIAAGMNMVNAIRGGGGGSAPSGGGGGSIPRAQAAPRASRETSVAPAQAAQQRQRVIRFDVQGDGMFADMLRQNVGAIAEAIVDEQRLGGTTILVGRE